MSNKYSLFYRNKKEILLDFNAGEISSDGAVVLLEKLERQFQVIKYFSEFIPDKRDPIRTIHETEKLLKQRVFLMIQGYEDANDVTQLQNDPLIKDILRGTWHKAQQCYSKVERYPSEQLHPKLISRDELVQFG